MENAQEIMRSWAARAKKWKILPMLLQRGAISNRMDQDLGKTEQKLDTYAHVHRSEIYQLTDLHEDMVKNKSIFKILFTYSKDRIN